MRSHIASIASIPNTLIDSRRRALVLPREHGAWGMLLVPLVTGAVAGNPHGYRIIWIFLFAVVTLGLLCLRTPIEAALGSSHLPPQNRGERRLIHCVIYFYASAVLLALAVLIFRAHAYGLWLLGAVAAIVFLLQSVLKRLGRQTRMIAQLTGTIALSSTSAGAYYLATGYFGRLALIVWLANWLFAANQIHFVQLRIHSARDVARGEKWRLARGFLMHQAFSLLFLGLIWKARWLPGIILVAFAPLMVRGLAWLFASPRPLKVHRLGISELLYAIAFGMLFIVGFHH